MSDRFISDDWRDKVESAVRWFKSPFSDDILLSCIDTERQMTRVAGQTLATEVVNLQKELTESAQATLRMAKIASDHKEKIVDLQAMHLESYGKLDDINCTLNEQLILAVNALKQIQQGLTNNFVRVEMLTKDLATKTLKEIEALK